MRCCDRPALSRALRRAASRTRLTAAAMTRALSPPSSPLLHGAASAARVAAPARLALRITCAALRRPKKRSVRYLREDEMEAHVAAAACDQGLDDSAAK